MNPTPIYHVGRQAPKSPVIKRWPLISLSVPVLALLGAVHVHAQSATGWTGATDGLWNFGGNWTNGIPNTNPPPSGGQAARILNFGVLGNARPNSTNNMPGGAGSTTGVSTLAIKPKKVNARKAARAVGRTDAFKKMMASEPEFGK